MFVYLATVQLDVVPLMGNASLLAAAPGTVSLPFVAEPNGGTTLDYDPSSKRCTQQGDGDSSTCRTSLASCSAR